MKGKTKDIFIIGFALFSMFFGAGNVIFPPHLGMQSGAQWLMGFACYYLADIGLALVALFAMLKCGSTEGISDLPDEALPEALRPVRERLRTAAEAETEEV